MAVVRRWIELQNDYLPAERMENTDHYFVDYCAEYESPAGKKRVTRRRGVLTVTAPGRRDREFFLLALADSKHVALVKDGKPVEIPA